MKCLVILRQELFNADVTAKADSILRLKGLEKTCILWSTRADIENSKEAFEVDYTILTPTSSVLIVALFDGTREFFRPVIARLRRDRLIFGIRKHMRNSNYSVMRKKLRHNR